AEASKQAPTWTEESCRNWFKTFVNFDLEEKDCINFEGLEKFCEDIGISVQGFEVLVLCFKLNCKRMGFIEESEFLDGMRSLKCWETAQLKPLLQQLSLQILHDQKTFNEFFKWCFDFTKESDQRTIGIDISIEMFKVIFQLDAATLNNKKSNTSASNNPHIKKFIEFLQYKQKEEGLKALNRDQWNSFVEFSAQIDKNCSNYDYQGS
ncbi:hypothetical protein HK099_002375, partial [Clydaea vesicula]